MEHANSYWRERLPANLKSTYDSAAENLERGNKSCPAYTRDRDGLFKCMCAVTSDNPQYFWLKPRFTIVSSVFGTSVRLSSLYSGAQIADIKRECGRIASSVRGKTALDTERNIAEYIVKNVAYEIDAQRNQNMASALYFKRAQCSGIAAAVKYLCDENGIWCIIVDGTWENDAHAWNIVCIDGKYYHLDVTGMLGANEGNPRGLKYAFVNYSDGRLAATHKWDYSQVPACPQNLTLDGTYAADIGGEDAFTNMSDFRIAVKKVIDGGRRSYSFVLNVGATADERMSLIKESLKMVTAQNRGVSCGIEVKGTFCTVTFKYR